MQKNKTVRNGPRYPFARFSAILILVIAVLAGAMLLYSLITSRVIGASVQSMEELALHDEVSIITSVKYRWNTLAGVGVECRQMRCETIQEVLNLLRMKEDSMNCIDLALVDENEDVYFGALFIARDETITELCRAGQDRFVTRYDGAGQNADTKRECLLLGVKITPFTVEGKTFTYIVCRFHIDTLCDELKIDSYGGAGYSSVIDLDGNYIVNMNRSHSVQERSNFYTDLEDFHFNGGVTVEYVREHIRQGEAFTISYELDGGEELVRFTPMEELGWYFVMSVAQSVFEDQSMGILRIVLLIFIAMGLALLLILFLILHARHTARQSRLEQFHREELSEALAMAEQANRAKTAFLNNMSHDIRTPMNAIIGFTNLAMARIDDKAQVKDYLTKISQSSNHLLSLINDVLDMSRIESGKVVIEEKPENLNDILNNIRSMTQADVQAKQLNMSIEAVNVTDENVLCDRLRLNQVLLNLLSNAMKFTPAGGTVSVKLIQLPSGEPERGAYELHVRDTGIGMSREFAATIFEPFTRERTSTVSGIQGTGLGMSITKNIVDMMGGHIEVHSEQGKGTEFIVSLAFKLQDNPQKAKNVLTETSETSEIPEISEISFEGRRLLLAEDNELNQEIATEILQDAGFVVETAVNGQEAVNAVRQSEPGYFDAVLMDVQMPVMDGYEASKAIRQLENPELANILIIAMTANAFEEDRQNALDAGMNAHVGKPIDIPALLDTLKRFLL